MTMDSSNKLDIGAKHGRDFRRTILIVDDEPVNLRILGNILGDEYDIDFATSAMTLTARPPAVRTSTIKILKTVTTIRLFRRKRCRADFCLPFCFLLF